MDYRTFNGKTLGMTNIYLIKYNLNFETINHK